MKGCPSGAGDSIRLVISFETAHLTTKQEQGSSARQFQQGNHKIKGSIPPSRDAKIHADPEADKETPAKMAPKKRDQTPHRPHSTPLTRARAAVGALLSSGMNTSLSCSIHNFAPSESIVLSSSVINKDIVYITQPPISLAYPSITHPSTFFITPTLPPGLPPSIIHVPEAGPHSPKYPTQSKVKIQAPDHIGIGLDTTPIPPKPPRGCPSSLSKAKLQVEEEIASGKQNTIHKALRALNTLANPPP